MRILWRILFLFFFVFNITLKSAGKGEAVSAVGIVSSLYISVISPDSGEIWKSGSVHEIKWYAPSKYFANVKIEYTTDRGNTWLTIAESVPSADTVYSWFVPYTPSYDCLVSIYETPYLYGHYGAYGYSYDTFMIWSPLADTSSTIQVIAPNGGEIWNAGTTQKIKWEIPPNNIDSLKIEYTTDNGATWTTESSSFRAADSSYDWFVPNKPSKFCLIRLSDAADSSNRDISNTLFSIDSLVTGIKDVFTSNPGEYQILDAYPNPFNPSTTIQYYLPEDANVKLFIYNELGELIRKLVDGNNSRGSHFVRWNGKNNSGAEVSSGIYFYRFEARGINGQKISSKKMFLLK